ncbi:MAG TPA: GNAT family N-acetyltransferase [Candidatus Saccharimonadales bacterium]|nr:GNAT family N-acetyltransferase [Candidatus Saccharimonadales bacterium]
MAEALRTEVRRPDEIVDWSVIHKLRWEGLDSHFGWTGWPAPTERDQDPEARHILTFNGDELVGAVRVLPGKKMGQWLVGRMVAKYQRQGIGSITYERAEFEAISLGATSFALAAVPLEGTVEFYEHHGYTKTDGIEICPGAYGEVRCAEMEKEIKNHDQT